MSKSATGLSALREEKFRFTVETQGLHYSAQPKVEASEDDDTVWSDGDEHGRRRHQRAQQSPPQAQRIAAELSRLFQEGGSSGGLTDAALERALAGAVPKDTAVAGMDVAKDYIKQILGELYGDSGVNSAGGPNAAASKDTSAVAKPAAAGSSGSWLGAAAPAQSATRPSAAPAGSGGGFSWPPQPWPQSSSTTPPSQAGAGLGTGAGRTTALDHEEERPRPRPQSQPHYGRIKEQLDLLQNADQLAAIISVATTAATTAAAAAVKHSMQTPPPLPPGAYARMQPGLLIGAGAPRGAGDDQGDEGDSPDPQPQQRRGALVAPHRRSTPVIMRGGVKGAAAGARHGEEGEDVDEAAGDAEHAAAERDGAAAGGDGPARPRNPHQQPWIDKLATPFNQGAAAGPGARGPGGSAMRVVHLGAPRVTARTPPPGAAAPPAWRQQQEQQPANAAGAGQQPHPDAQGAQAGTRGVVPVPFPGLDGVGGTANGSFQAAGSQQAQAQQRQQQHELQPEATFTAAHSDGGAAPNAQLFSGQNALQQQRLGGAQRLAAGEVPEEGVFVPSGPSLFAQANSASAAGGGGNGGGFAGFGALGPGGQAQQQQQQLPRPRRSELPDDVKDVFRNTLAFISDPDGVRAAQQPPPPAWAAMADVEERREAQREADELLGGAFDYAAARKELEQAKRSSRLMQQPGAAAAPAAAVAGALPTVTAAGAGPRGVGVSTGGAVRGAGRSERGRSAAGAALGMEAAAPVAVAAPALRRGDFAGVLPPPHSVWDVDEAWFDLDEFSKAVEAEVSYRAAAAPGAASRRGSPGPKSLAGPLLGGRALRAGGLGAGAGAGGGLAALEALKAQMQERRAAAATGAGAATLGDAAPAAPAPRKRSASPPGPTVPTAPALSARRERESSQSPPPRREASRPTGPVRVAFGRRVSEPPKPETTRARSTSPSQPKRRVKKSAAGGTASRAKAGGGAGGSPSSAATDAAMEHMLSALASVLLSDGGGDDSEPEREDAPPAAGQAGTGRNAGADGPAEGAEWPVAAPTAAAAGDAAHVDSTAAGGGVEGMQRVDAAAPEARLTAGLGGHTTTAVTATAVGGNGGAGGGTAPWLQPGTQAWPLTTATARPRFTYVVDTGHAPVTTRLPAWAASAAKAADAASAYAAAAGEAPAGLGFATPTRSRRPAPGAAAGAPGTPFLPGLPLGAGGMPGAAPSAAAGAAAAPGGAVEAGSEANPMAANKLSYAYAHHQFGYQRPQQAAAAYGVHNPLQPPALSQLQPQGQLLAFPAPSDPATFTHILPPQAAAAALASAAAMSTRQAKGQTPRKQKAPVDPAQQLEEALMQAVEDEVVSRLALAQLATALVDSGAGAQPPADDGAGMVPPLVDAELTRQLVCDVLRDNLRSILSTPQWQQEAARAQQRAAEPLSLEEVVAQLAAMPLMPPPRGPPQTTGMEGGVGQAQAEGAPDVDAEAAAGVDVEPTGLENAGYAQVPASHSGEEAAEGYQPAAGHDAAEGGATAPLDAVASRVSAGEEEDEAASVGGAGAASAAAPPPLGSQASHASLQSGPSASALSMQGSQHPLQSGPSQRSVSRVGHPPTGHPPLHPPPSAQPSSASLPPHPHALPAPHALPGHAAAASGAPPALPAPPGSAPLVVGTAQPWDQHHGPAAAAAAAADDGGSQPGSAGLALVVQAHGVQGRGTQAHGVDDRGTQAHAVQDVGTQAAGVKDSGSQADPPPPHYLLQAALAAGLSYGTGHPAPPGVGTAPPAPSPYVGPDMEPPHGLPRPYYLVPADGSQIQLPPTYAAGLYGHLPLFNAMAGLAGGGGGAGGGGRRPELRLPGLKKLRDSSDVESSSDSMQRHLRGPGARGRDLLDDSSSDGGAMQRSYAQLELASLTARPLRLDLHRAALQQQQQHGLYTPADANTDSGESHLTRGDPVGLSMSGVAPGLMLLSENGMGAGAARGGRWPSDTGIGYGGPHPLYPQRVGSYGPGGSEGAGPGAGPGPGSGGLPGNGMGSRAMSGQLGLGSLRGTGAAPSRLNSLGVESVVAAEAAVLAVAVAAEAAAADEGVAGNGAGGSAAGSVAGQRVPYLPHMAASGRSERSEAPSQASHGSRAHGGPRAEGESTSGRGGRASAAAGSVAGSVAEEKVRGLAGEAVVSRSGSTARSERLPPVLARAGSSVSAASAAGAGPSAGRASTSRTEVMQEEVEEMVVAEASGAGSATASSAVGSSPAGDTQAAAGVPLPPPAPPAAPQAPPVPPTPPAVGDDEYVEDDFEEDDDMDQIQNVDFGSDDDDFGADLDLEGADADSDADAVPRRPPPPPPPRAAPQPQPESAEVETVVAADAGDGATQGNEQEVEDAVEELEVLHSESGSEDPAAAETGVGRSGSARASATASLSGGGEAAATTAGSAQLSRAASLSQGSGTGGGRGPATAAAAAPATAATAHAGRQEAEDALELLDEEEVGRVLAAEDERELAALGDDDGGSVLGERAEEGEEVEVEGREDVWTASSMRDRRQQQVDEAGEEMQSALRDPEQQEQAELGSAVQSRQPSASLPLPTPDSAAGSQPGSAAASALQSRQPSFASSAAAAGRSSGLGPAPPSGALTAASAASLAGGGTGTGAGGGGAEAAPGDAASVRSSMERMARAGLAPLEPPSRLASIGAASSAGAGSFTSSVALTPVAAVAGAVSGAPPALLTAGVVGGGRPGSTASLQRPALAPLQPVAATSAVAHAPASPGKPPALSDYQGPVGRLWRPPSAGAGGAPDPLLSSSSETLMASSEASGPSPDAVTRALAEGERRAATIRAGGAGSLAAAVARAQAAVAGGQLPPLPSELGSLEVSSSVSTSGGDPSASTDSLSGVSGVTPPRSNQLAAARAMLARRQQELGGAGEGTQRRRGGPAVLEAIGELEVSVGGGEGGGGRDGEEASGTGSEASSPGQPRQSLPQPQQLPAGSALPRPLAGGRGLAAAGAGAGRGRDGAVFRLRQYGARRRKLMQQIGVADPLLMSSATSLSTDDSNDSGSDSDDYQ